MTALENMCSDGVIIQGLQGQGLGGIQYLAEWNIRKYLSHQERKTAHNSEQRF